MTGTRILAAAMTLVLGAVALLVLAAALSALVLHGPVDGRSLQRSVEFEAGSLQQADRGCRRGSRPRVWRCEVDDAQSSGIVAYRVVVERGGSCWTARRVGRAGGSPARIAGCVMRWQPRPFG